MFRYSPSPDDVRTFLLASGVLKSVVDLLYNEKVTGQMFDDLVESDLKELIQHEAGPVNLLEPAKEAKLFEVIDEKTVLMIR